jgi:hypothetical protein
MRLSTSGEDRHKKFLLTYEAGFLDPWANLMGYRFVSCVFLVVFKCILFDEGIIHQGGILVLRLSNS